MTYNEFKEKWLGAKVDYDGAYGHQCWDLAEQYITECLGLPNFIIAGLPTGIVSDLLVEPKLSLMKKYFDVIPLNQKQAGDIEVFDWGHIAIMDSWDNVKKVNIYLTQNSGTADKPVGGVYLGAIGDNPKCMAFRKKVVVVPIDYQAKYNEEVEKNRTLTTENYNLKGTIKQNSDKIAELNTEVAKLNLNVESDKAKIDNLTNLASNKDKEILIFKQNEIALNDTIERLSKDLLNANNNYKVVFNIGKLYLCVKLDELQEK